VAAGEKITALLRRGALSRRAARAGPRRPVRPSPVRLHPLSPRPRSGWHFHDHGILSVTMTEKIP
jgi:hypothetical protein